MAVSPLDAIAQADNSAKMGSMPSPEASRRNLAKAQACWRRPVPGAAKRKPNWSDMWP